MTRAALGVEPVICDVFDAECLTATITGFAPDAVMHQLTDPPDRLDQLFDFGPRNDRICHRAHPAPTGIVLVTEESAESS